MMNVLNVMNMERDVVLVSLCNVPLRIHRRLKSVLPVHLQKSLAEVKAERIAEAEVLGIDLSGREDGYTTGINIFDRERSIRTTTLIDQFLGLRLNLVDAYRIQRRFTFVFAECNEGECLCDYSKCWALANETINNLWFTNVTVWVNPKAQKGANGDYTGRVTRMDTITLYGARYSNQPARELKIDGNGYRLIDSTQKQSGGLVNLATVFDALVSPAQ